MSNRRTAIDAALHAKMLKTWEGHKKEREKTGESILYVLIIYFLDSISRAELSFLMADTNKPSDNLTFLCFKDKYITCGLCSSECRKG